MFYQQGSVLRAVSFLLIVALSLKGDLSCLNSVGDGGIPSHLPAL